MHSSSCFKTLFGSQSVSRSQTLQKCAREHFSPSFSSFWNKKSWKTSLLVGFQILGLFVTPLTADVKYCCHNTENLAQAIQMYLSQKLNPFSHDFIAFLDSTLNLEHFEKEVQPHSLSISEIIHTEKSDYLNA